MGVVQKNLIKVTGPRGPVLVLGPNAHKALSLEPTSLLTETFWRHPKLPSTNREASGTTRWQLACYHLAPQEAGVHEPGSLLATPFLGKAASTVRGPFYRVQ